MDKKRIIWLVILVLWLGCVIYTFFDNEDDKTNPNYGYEEDSLFDL